MQQCFSHPASTQLFTLSMASLSRSRLFPFCRSTSNHLHPIKENWVVRFHRSFQNLTWIDCMSHWTSVAGLCGNFNDDQCDDFKTTTGPIEGTAVAFANTWKTQSCNNIENLRGTPCDLNYDRGTVAKWPQRSHCFYHCSCYSINTHLFVLQSCMPNNGVHCCQTQKVFFPSATPQYTQRTTKM